MTILKRNHLEDWLILGYTTRDYLLLDLDDTDLGRAVKLARKVMEFYPKVGDALILRSSNKELEIRYTYYRRRPKMRVQRENYHLVFNNRIGYNSCCRICEALATFGVLERSYMRCRGFRGDMTLRVSTSPISGGPKPAPVAVLGLKNPLTNEPGDGIEKYLDFCRGASKLRLDHGLGSRENNLDTNDCP